MTKQNKSKEKIVITKKEKMEAIKKKRTPVPQKPPKVEKNPDAYDRDKLKDALRKDKK